MYAITNPLIRGDNRLGDKHPYVSGPGAITGAINNFRRTLPPTVTADTLRKLGIASNNESYVINVLRFIGVIDDSGNVTSVGKSVFNKHDNAEFQSAFEGLLKSAYKDLFEIRGDTTWTLDDNALISFFRGSDGTSDLVGRRQTLTFRVLASYAGHGDPGGTRGTSSSKGAVVKLKSNVGKQRITRIASESERGASKSGRDFGLTVRIEVNLPAAGDQERYDRIFRSIKENLLNG